MIWGQLFAGVLVFMFVLNFWCFYSMKGMFTGFLLMGVASILGAASGWLARFILDILKGV
jgi:hypothetical protein